MEVPSKLDCIKDEVVETDALSDIMESPLGNSSFTPQKKHSCITGQVADLQTVNERVEQWDDKVENTKLELLEVEVIIKDETIAEPLSEINLRVTDDLVVCNNQDSKSSVPKLNKNAVEELLKIHFSKRRFEEKLEIKTLGRPTPILNLKQSGHSKNSSYKRQFNKKIYKEVSWICGCEIRNALFCFPCVLFKGERSWSVKGVTNLAHLQEYIKRHQENKAHMMNVLNLTNIGRVNIATQVDSAYRLSIKKHNEQVEKNRYILSKIIDCIKFCGAFELALRGHDESESSNNPGLFRGLIDLMGSVDTAIKEHVESDSVFKGTSKTIQNELLDCILTICQEEIKSEISTAAFVAIIADDTTDISETTQTALVLRYEHYGKVKERFWSFLNPEGQDALAISQSILKEINPLVTNEKLIAQSYDGAPVMSGKLNGVQAKIRETYSNAHFIHCYAHQLNLIMTQCASENKGARVFFSRLSGIPAFFSHSPVRLAALHQAVTRKIPGVRVVRWDFRSRVVNLVYDNKFAFIDCFEKLENSKSAETVQKARALRLDLEDKEFNFWLSFFHAVMPHVEILYKQVQSRQANAVQINQFINSFKDNILKVRNDTDQILGKVTETLATTSKRRREEDCLTSDAKEVCDLIISQAEDRFSSVEHFDIAKLIDSAEFQANSKNFPENNLIIAVETYPILNKNRLRTELTVLYERQDLRKINGALPLLDFILGNNVEDTFLELTKLLRILITTPMSSTEAERCFSTLNRIKTFLRNTMSQERLNALAMLSIEKDLVKNIKNFNAKVIDKFVSYKNRSMDYIFRH